MNFSPRILFLFVFILTKAISQKPNVLLIYTDDHRFSGVHSLGKQAVKTPHLDALVKNGIAFTKTYLMGAFSGATCIPSRAMLLTGRQLFQLEGKGRTIPKSHTMLGEAFMASGYHAHHIGKWHQDLQSLSRSYHTGGKVSGKPKYLTDQYRMPFIDWRADGKFSPKDCYLLEYDTNGKTISRPLSKSDKRGPTGTEQNAPHVSEVLADNAIEFLDSYNKQKPFYMYLAFPTPHDPRQAPDKFKKMYPEEKMELTPSYLPQHPFHNGHIFLRDERLAEWPRTTAIAKKELSDYYGIITHLDDQIGRVIRSLKKSGQYNNTLIVMAGDSGLAVGNHGLLGKQNIYDEDGIHVPFIVSGGALSSKHKGKRIDALSYIHDIMPTICDLAGVKIPTTVQGKSLVPVIEGTLPQIRDYTYHAYRQHQRAYRKGDFKLIEYVRTPTKDRNIPEAHLGSRVTQLFNTTKDPWETFNLADFPEYHDRIETMRIEMKQKAMELGDYADGKRIDVDFWNYFK